jgi:hypothetical protein
MIAEKEGKKYNRSFLLIMDDIAFDKKLVKSADFR